MALSKPQWLFNLSTFKKSPERTIKTLVHKITISAWDDDSEVSLAEPLLEWTKTEKGKFVMEHSRPSPSYHTDPNHANFQDTFYIIAYFDEKTHIYWKLKYE